MAENWKSYFCNVNDKLASIALDLSLREIAPIKEKPWLLWIWVYLRNPRPDGLSDRSEFNTICAIEDALTEQIAAHCGGIHVGRITTQGRREFYFYGSSNRAFKTAVTTAMSRFAQYTFDQDAQQESDWNQYFKVLWPSGRDMQRIANRDVLDRMKELGDTPEAVRDVHHWIYFKTAENRTWFTSAVKELGYSIENEPTSASGEHPYGLVIVRDQQATPETIDEAVLELYELAGEVSADYDGWEAQVISTRH